MKGNEALAVFTEEFNRCREVLALQDWDCTIKAKRMRDAKADIDPDLPAHMATVRVNTAMDLSAQEWRRTARHECCHLFVAKLRWLAGERYVSEDELDREYERLAVIGEKLMIERAGGGK